MLAERPGGWLACRGAAQEDKHYLSGCWPTERPKKDKYYLSQPCGRPGLATQRGRALGGSQPASKPKKTSTMHLKPLASCATRRRQALPPSSLRPATLPKEDTHYIFRASDQLCYPGKTSTIFPEPACCAIRRRQALSLARRLAGCSIQAGGVGARLVSGRKIQGWMVVPESINPSRLCPTDTACRTLRCRRV